MDVLGDETKRQIYDIHGLEGVKEMEARKGQSYQGKRPLLSTYKNLYIIVILCFNILPINIII
jgi:DnaJ-class molecular chaperone